ncbi:Phenylacetaldehyde synthase [Fulvia fulva]|nr:Phenylacetaldehyde synthase [Fulvia fulva]
MAGPTDAANGHTNGTSKLDNRTVPPLGMTSSQFLEAGSSVLKDIEEYYTNLHSRPVVAQIEPGYLSKLLPASPPTEGETWKDIERDIETKIMPGVTHWQHPKFMAYFPASSTYPGILGEMWSAALTAPAFNWSCSPVVTELETHVLDWIAQIIGLPEAFHSKSTGGGVIQGSASEAIVTVMIAARERFVRRQIEQEGLTDPEEIEDRSCEIRSRLVALASDQAHSSSQKGSNIAGTRFRSLPTRHGDAYALRGHDLRKKLQDLESKGLHPYYLTISLGATSVCAVDAFAEIAEVAKDYPNLWIHVDAAYAGAALVLPETHHYSTSLSFVDSFDFNMHKWLLTNFDASCLYVQNRNSLTSALGITPHYLKNEFSESGLVTDYRDWQIPLGRRFRALKIWFVVRTFGVRGLQEHIRHHLALGDLFADLVRSRPDLFKILSPPSFALTVITVNPRKSSPLHLTNGAQGSDPRPFEETQSVIDPKTNGDVDLKAGNEVTEKVFTIIDKQKEFFLTSTVVDGVYAIRIVSANPLAEERYVRQVFERLVETAEAVLDG